MCGRHLYSRSWAALWALHTIEQDGLAITPRANLVRNIGFTEDAVHTKPGTDIPDTPQLFEMTFPLVHPDKVELREDLQQQIANEVDRTWRRKRR